MRTIIALIISMIVCAPVFAEEYHAASKVYRVVSAAYEENKLAAEKKYKGIRINIGGFVNKIDKNLLGKPQVTLTAGTLRFIICEFPKNTYQLNDLMELKKGSYFKGEGTIRNKRLTSVFLENCVLKSYSQPGQW